MKNLFVVLALLVPFAASAFEWQLTPANGDPAKVAKQAAATMGMYVMSVEGIDQGVASLSGFTKEANKRVIKGIATICYGPESEMSFQEEKPIAPSVCVIDVATLRNVTKASGAARRYNASLPTPMTEASFKAKLTAILAE